MDINCVESCANQQEGKCTLYELPVQSVQGERQSGCFYHKQPQSSITT